MEHCPVWTRTFLLLRDGPMLRQKRLHRLVPDTPSINPYSLLKSSDQLLGVSVEDDTEHTVAPDFPGAVR